MLPERSMSRTTVGVMRSKSTSRSTQTAGAPPMAGSKSVRMKVPAAPLSDGIEGPLPPLPLPTSATQRPSLQEPDAHAASDAHAAPVPAQSPDVHPSPTDASPSEL